MTYNRHTDIIGLLHLKSGLTELAPGVLLLSKLLMTEYQFSWAKEVIELPQEEDHGVNVLPLNDKVLISKNCPTVLSTAKKYYPEQNIIQLNMSENYKMDGALTCMSLRY
jgi:dimethylargininase